MSAREEHIVAAAGRVAALARSAQAGAAIMHGLRDALLSSWSRFRRFWLWVLMFWAAAAFLNWTMLADHYTNYLGDTDDALRLVQWRLFRDGAGWHDLLIARMGAPEGLQSHWSRLVDAGLLALYWPLALFMPEKGAETLMRLLWPLVLMLPLMAATAAIARTIGGRRALIPALVLTVLSLPVQFTPGRIDHHNVQIVLLMLSWAFMFIGLRRPIMMLPAGLLVPVTMAVGLEALSWLLLVPLTATLAWDPDRPETTRGLTFLGSGLAVGALVMLLSAAPPSHLLQTACDAYAANWALPLLLAGAGLALLPLFPARWLARASRRLAAAAGLALMVIVLFTILEPRCLQGPFAGMPETVRKAWLAHVKEMQPITHVLASPDLLPTWFAIAVFSFLALAMWRFAPRQNTKPRLAEAMLGLATLASLVMGMLHLRLLVYAQWLALPLLAVALARILPRRTLPWQGLRASLAVFLSPLSVMMALMVFLHQSGLSGKAERAKEASPAPSACLKDSALKPLAALPAGFLAGDLRLQPFVLARTSHRVLAGPYHRIAGKIEANIRLLDDPPERARMRALTLGLDYIAICPQAQVHGPDGRPPGPDSLWRHLLHGEVPEWLEPVRLSAPTPIRVYRVKASRPLPATLDLPETLMEGIRPERGADGLRQTLHE